METKTGIAKDAETVWEIITGEYINVYRNGRFYQMFAAPSVKTHLEAVKIIARRVFGHGEGVLRLQDGGCQVPSPCYERWGWTRETRGYGQASVIVDKYLVILK